MYYLFLAQTGKTPKKIKQSNPYENLSFFVVFQFFLQRSYTVALRKRVPEEAASHVRYRIFCTHFFDVAKKSSSEQNSIFNPYTSGSEKACEKSVKKVVRASSDLSVLYTIPLCKTCKFKRSLTVGNFGRHQNACFVHEIIRLPTWIMFFFVFFHVFLTNNVQKLLPAGYAHTRRQQKRVPEEGKIGRIYTIFDFFTYFLGARPANRPLPPNPGL